jgi:uncharacterized protein
MRIRIDEIPESGRFLHFHWDEERLRHFLPPDDPFDIELVRPVNVDLEIQKRPDHIHVAGAINATLRLTCHRCLQAFDRALEEAVDLFLMEEKKIPQEEELELEPEELEYDFFDGEVIEIDRLVAEQIFLALPFKILCSETCMGLCPDCGANLNQEPCTCDRTTKQSPFAVLQKIIDG